MFIFSTWFKIKFVSLFIHGANIFSTWFSPFNCSYTAKFASLHTAKCKEMLFCTSFSCICLVTMMKQFIRRLAVNKIQGLSEEKLLHIIMTFKGDYIEDCQNTKDDVNVTSIKVSNNQ